MLKPRDKVTVEVNNIGKEYSNFLWEAQAEIRGRILFSADHLQM